MWGFLGALGVVAWIVTAVLWLWTPQAEHDVKDVGPLVVDCPTAFGDTPDYFASPGYEEIRAECVHDRRIQRTAGAVTGTGVAAFAAAAVGFRRRNEF